MADRVEWDRDKSVVLGQGWLDVTELLVEASPERREPVLRDGLISPPDPDAAERRAAPPAVPPNAVVLADEVGELVAEFPDRERWLLVAGEAERDVLASPGRVSSER